MPASCATRGLSVKGNFCQLRFLFYCKSQTEEICLRIPQLCFSLLCHMELRLGVRDDRIGFSKIVLVRSTSWEIVGLDTNKSHALWTAANRVRRLRKGTNVSFATFSWQRWPLSLSHSLLLCLSFKLSPSRSNSELADISIAQSNQQKDQLLLAFELYQGTFNHHSFTNCTFRFARQYNRPTKPSPAPRTLQPSCCFFSLNTV